MWLEQKYIGLVSARLERFKRVDRTIFNFRCPICGDSTKHRSKARGYIFEKDGTGFLYHCHNCNITLGIDKFIEQLDPTLYKEYLREKLIEKYEKPRKTERAKSDVELFAEKMKKPTFIKTTALNNLKKISQLNAEHPAKEYVVKRMIPNPWHAKLFYAPRFKEFVNTVLPGKFDKDSLTREEPRLIIPFLDEEKNLFGFQGRGFSRTGIRYITIMLDDTKPKIFGLDTCKRDRTHFVFEGPIDSMFIENSVAMAGGSYPKDMINQHTVFVYDNEPRAPETIKKIHKCIKNGYKVAFFPDKYQEKDVNDMVLNGAYAYDICRELQFNIFHGMSAEMKLTDWRKV